MNNALRAEYGQIEEVGLLHDTSQGVETRRHVFRVTSSS